MRNVLASLCVVAATLTAVPVLAQDGATPLGPEDVKRELVGKIWQVELPNGVSAEETFRADGTVKITGGLSDRGYWRVWEQGLHAVVPDAQGCGALLHRWTGPPTARSGCSSPMARSR